MWHNDLQLNIIREIQKMHSPFLDHLFQMITMCGESYLAIIFFIIIYWCVNKEFGYRLALIIISNNTINGCLKDVFKVPRLFWKGQMHKGIRSLRTYTATGYSFPSGHTQGISSFFTSLMIKIREKYIYVFGVIMILLVGISRLYLGVHRPIDVFFGAIFGITWAIVFNFILDFIEKKDKKYILICLVPMIAGFLVYKTSNYSSMAGAFTGIILGYLLEPKYIDYRIKRGIKNSILKIVIGITGAAVVYFIIKSILAEKLLFFFIQTFALTLWITLGATLTFKKLNI